ncbi:MAG: ergothioneine biosynthesis protein EgtB [Gemmatimonadota bacterium]|nr:ergothioneine biosynthesis protein EgtB [Gemmatimonadota bacterium]MDH3423653.1 ergothioneine biosynthesis protein EgtB [Gemmatimonadota bacterium]
MGITAEVASRTSRSQVADDLLTRYRAVRTFSERMCQGMEAEDFVIQSMPDVSPTKWHLAHTTWFFEAFVLIPHEPGYQPLNAEYNYLFNSYYNTIGEQFCRPRRGQISRPTVREVTEYRHYVDERIAALIERLDADGRIGEIQDTVTLGTHHEQQHQELMTTDIKHVFSMNPLRPVWHARAQDAAPVGVPALEWIDHPGGLVSIGYEGTGFHFDNETRRHQVWLEPFQLGSRLVTNAEYMAFMEDRGYERPELWLSMGWAKVRETRLAENDWERIDKPLYWYLEGDEWWQFTLAGPRRVHADEPVVHVSYYEADAFARWASGRLPSEAEWEVMAAQSEIEGAFSDDFVFHPRPLSKDAAKGKAHQMFGDAWEWTRSAYEAYPGFKAWEGSAGEYNGKFMANQFVLRGGSCATPRDHIRPTYRNFFRAEDRWQFMGFRLARDAQ